MLIAPNASAEGTEKVQKQKAKEKGMQDILVYNTINMMPTLHFGTFNLWFLKSLCWQYFYFILRTVEPKHIIEAANKISVHCIEVLFKDL